MNFLTLLKKPNLIAAHRGNSSKKPENTFSALTSSIGKCDFIEIDIQLTHDLIPVVIHDDTLSRTSNISQMGKFEDRAPFRVSDFTEKELQSLDFGSWFDHKYEPLLTLEKALLFIKKHNQFLNIDIKDMSNTFKDDTVVKSVIEMIDKTQTGHLVLLSSFHHPYLLLCKKSSPQIPTAALKMYKHPSDLINYLHTLQVDAYHPQDKITNQKIVSSLREAGFFVNVFTVNKIKQQKKLFDWGVNGIFTDFLETEVETNPLKNLLN
ncbi:MAG: glycerophosphodiester phosphodiesterase [Epsilonproteobacteria bacterium]|nr:MAG: glycerophosphodiester phosphodiesterase [Campylobacterota bacterium]